MKKIMLLALFAVFALSINAQENYDPQTNGHIIFKLVSHKLDLKDKIIVSNQSSYTLLQVAVCLAEDNKLKPLGSCTNIEPGESGEIASFDDNALKNLQSRTIGIKAKGQKKDVGDNSGLEDVTYEFDVKLLEDDHDLIIELYNAPGKDVMNF